MLAGLRAILDLSSRGLKPSVNGDHLRLFAISAEVIDPMLELEQLVGRRVGVAECPVGVQGNLPDSLSENSWI